MMEAAAELQPAVVLHGARPGRQAPERPAAVLARLHKAALEPRADSARKADSIMGSELEASKAKALRISKAKAMLAFRETRTRRLVCKTARIGSQAAETHAHKLRIRSATRVRSEISQHAAAHGPAINPVYPQATLATASTAILKTAKLQVAIQLGPASLDSQTT